MAAPPPFRDEMGESHLEDDEGDLWMFILFVILVVIGLGIWVWFSV